MTGQTVGVALRVSRAFADARAHLKLLGRHGRETWHTWPAAGGAYRARWLYCIHRSHRLGLPCWRWFLHDGYCRKHAGTCWGRCNERTEP